MNASDKRRARRFPMTLPVAVKVEEITGQENPRRLLGKGFGQPEIKHLHLAFGRDLHDD